MNRGDLQRSIAAWDDHVRVDPTDAARRVRQVAYLLHIENGDLQRFLPIRLMIGWIGGIPFSQQGGRSIDIKDHYPGLAEMGLARIDESSPFFDLYWDRYTRHCAELGRPPARYFGDNPRTGRVFWAFPV